MKRCVLLLLLFVMSSVVNAREIKQLKNWKFIHSEVVGGQDMTFDDSSWESVVVPHDWAIGKPFDMNIDIQMVKVVEDGEKIEKLRTGRTGALPAFGVGWYRTHVSLPKEAEGAKVFVEFDGAMSHAQVYLNGVHIGNWPYGYSSFTFDLTENFKYGADNILAVRLDNKANSSRWYSGAGLYRNVRLVWSDPVYVGHWGTKITTPVVNVKMGEVNVKTDVFNQSGAASNVKLVSIVYNGEGKEVKRVASMQKVGEKSVFDQTLKISSPELWSVDSPNMYSLISELYVDGKRSDTYSSNFGFRTVLFDKDKGFFLNGKSLKIKGVCMHHDLGPLGAAVSRRATERQIEILKEMGCNAIRTSHNPP
ncbi:MAG: beta galactosidase jelly roll domain-containing protein, partial [Rikenellaceae bacterium]